MNLKTTLLTFLMASNFLFSQEKVIVSNGNQDLTVTPIEELENGKIENNIYRLKTSENFVSLVSFFIPLHNNIKWDS